MIIADGSSVWGECESVTKCFYVNASWRAALHWDLNIQLCMCHSVSLGDVSSVTVKRSVVIWKVLLKTPDRERWDGARARRWIENMAISSSEWRESRAHGWDQGCSSIYRKHLWITSPQIEGNHKRALTTLYLFWRFSRMDFSLIIALFWEKRE